MCGGCQVILGLPYGTKIDLWSLGCIMAELWTGRVLFQNDSVQTMLARMIGVIGALAVGGRDREGPCTPLWAGSTPSSPG